MSLRDLFNARKWNMGDLASLTIRVRHRGAPDDVRVIPGSAILEIQALGLFVEAKDAAGEPVDDGRAFLPYHRILRVSAAEGVLFQRASDD